MKKQLDESEEIACKILTQFYEPYGYKIDRHDYGLGDGKYDFNVLGKNNEKKIGVEVTRLTNIFRHALEEEIFYEKDTISAQLKFSWDLDLTIPKEFIRSSDEKDALKKYKKIINKILKSKSKFDLLADIENILLDKNMVSNTESFYFDFYDKTTFDDRLDVVLQTLKEQYPIISSIYVASADEPFVRFAAESQGGWVGSGNVIEAIERELCKKSDNINKCNKMSTKEKHLFFYITYYLSDAASGMRKKLPDKPIRLPKNAKLTHIWVCSRVIGTNDKFHVWKYCCRNANWKDVTSSLN
jgi:hypothetical protein